MPDYGSAEKWIEAADPLAEKLRGPFRQEPCDEVHWASLFTGGGDEQLSPPDFLVVGGLTTAGVPKLGALLRRLRPKRLVLQNSARTLERQGWRALCSTLSTLEPRPAMEVQERKLQDYGTYWYTPATLPGLCPLRLVVRGAAATLDDAAARALASAAWPLELVADGLRDEGGEQLRGVLRRLEAGGWPRLNLRRLELRNCGCTLGAIGAEALSEALLELAPSEVEPVVEWRREALYNGVEPFCALLPWMPAQLELDTCLNAIGYEGAMHLAQALRRHEAARPRRVELPIASLDDDGVLALAELLPWMRLGEQSLDLRNASSVLGARGSRALTACLALRAAKRQLPPRADFGVLRLTEAQARRLAAMLPLLRLEVLRLEYCASLTAAGAEALSQGLRHAAAPAVRLSVEGLRDDEVQPLAAIVRHLPNLELVLEESDALNVDGIRELIAALHAQDSLRSIAYCALKSSKVSEEFAELARKRPNVRWSGPTKSSTSGCYAWLCPQI